MRTIHQSRHRFDRLADRLATVFGILIAIGTLLIVPVLIYLVWTR